MLPLISVSGANHSDIMGAGSIDGRGGAKLLGQKSHGRDLAHEAKVTDKAQSVPWLIVVNHAKDFTLYNITLRNSPGFHIAVNNSGSSGTPAKFAGQIAAIRGLTEP